MSLYDTPFRISGQFTNELQAIEDLAALEKTYKESSWFRGNRHEPIVGDPDCPYLAQTYGLSRRSCLTVFVDVHDAAGHKCRFERCLSFTFKHLDEALKHLRQHHFGNRPFVCLPESGATWYVNSHSYSEAFGQCLLPDLDSLLMGCFSAERLSSQKPIYENTRISAHRRIAGRYLLLYL